MTSTAKYERKGQTITNLENGDVVDHKSVNKAKRWSREQQMEIDRALGRGSIRVIRT